MEKSEQEEIKHLAIIMDGNRRWAKERNCSVKKGHEAGAKALMDLCKILKNYNIELVTVYAFSVENNSRYKEEKDDLFEMLEKYLDSDIKKLQKEKVNVCCIGNFEIFPERIQRKIVKINENTPQEFTFTLNIALNYGGKQEIVDACGKIITNKEKVSVESISNYLYYKNMPDVDLLIRTGGKQRLSNFLLWEMSYAELYFCGTLWPNFNKMDLDLAINFYRQQERNFGV